MIGQQQKLFMFSTSISVNFSQFMLRRDRGISRLLHTSLELYTTCNLVELLVGSWDLTVGYGLGRLTGQASLLLDWRLLGQTWSLTAGFR